MARADRDRTALHAACAVAFLVAACAREAAPPNVIAPSGPPAAQTGPAAREAVAAESPATAPGAPLASSPSAMPASATATATTPPSADKPIPMPALGSDDALVVQILSRGGNALKTVLSAPETYRFQVAYALVTSGAKPALERHAFRADAEYFYPASSMKVPIALAAYDWAAGKPFLVRDAPMKIHPLSGGGEPVSTTLARETWRALIVSDNTSANRLLGIVGHREVHETLWSLGLASARVRAGFSPAETNDPAELSPEIDVGGQQIAPRKSDLALPPNDAKGLDVGKAYIDGAGRRVEKPMSFADKNAMRLRELQDALVRIMRPELLPASAKRDAMRPDDLAYLRETLGTLPSESGLAGFDRNVVADYQLIPFLRGIERVRPRGTFEIHSKVGQAFGFLIGNAYVVDKDTGRAFFLAAAVYANPNETLNDDEYAYDTIAFPALADVAEVFCRHAFGG